MCPTDQNLGQDTEMRMQTPYRQRLSKDPLQNPLLPLHHAEVDGVEVCHHHGRVQDVVEEHQDRQHHVRYVNVSATKRMQEVLRL